MPIAAGTHHGVPASFNDERGVRVAQADNLFCHRHFLLLQDASFADVGGLFQSCQIFSDETQDFLAHQTPTRWQIDTALQVPANRLQIAQQTFAQPANASQQLEIQLLALGFSPHFAIEEMNLLAQAPKLLLLLQEPNRIHVRQIQSV